MESLHEKIEGLHEKLDSVQTALAMLPEQMLLAMKPPAIPIAAPLKDILSDEDQITSRPPSTNGKVLSPEAQIQRLTAQLTAAYNRIAALEEQLMARRNY